jgi:hypothetical protein
MAATGSSNMYFPAQVTVSYDPKKTNAFYINYFRILY